MKWLMPMDCRVMVAGGRKATLRLPRAVDTDVL